MLLILWHCFILLLKVSETFLKYLSHVRDNKKSFSGNILIDYPKTKQSGRGLNGCSDLFSAFF